MTRIRGEQPVKPHQIGSTLRHKRREPGYEVQRLEQNVGDAMAGNRVVRHMSAGRVDVCGARHGADAELYRGAASQEVPQLRAARDRRDQLRADVPPRPVSSSVSSATATGATPH